MLQTYQISFYGSGSFSRSNPAYFILLSHLISLRFVLSMCSWNQLPVNLFPGIRASSGSLPIDWPFNPVAKILPILTGMEQFQFVCVKALARVIRKVKFTQLLCVNWNGTRKLICSVIVGLWEKKGRGVWNNCQVHYNSGPRPCATPYSIVRTHFTPG